MAVTYNIKGTTNSSFKVGKQGTGTVYAGGLEANNIQATGNLTVTGNLVVSGTTTTVNSTTIDVQNSLRFEGATSDDFETTLTLVDPTADRTITLPNATGTLVLQDTTDTLTNKTINSNSNTITITESNISDLGSYITASSSDTLSNKVHTTLNVNNAYSFPTTDGSVGQVLATDGSDTVSFSSFGFPKDMGAISGSTSSFPVGTAPDFGALSGDDYIGHDFGGLTNPYTDTDTGILLTDLSVGSDASASGSGGIAYNSTTGVFTYTPPSLTAKLENIIEDTTPQLGGDLDAQSNQITAVSKLEITNTSTDDSLLITTTEDSNTAAPVITLKRNSSSPADADYLGQIKFKGENDADQEQVYAKITGKILDASDGSEDGILEFAFKKAGSNNISARFRSDSLQLINGTTLVVSNITYPTADGNNGQVIKTNGSGTLSMGDVNQDTVNALSAAASVALDPTTGGIQTITLGQNTTFTLSNWSTGHRMTLMIDDGSGYTVTWPTMQWAGGVAPTLGTSGYNTIELWYVGSTLYGAYVGNMS